MSDFAIIFQILVGVLALFFIYLTYMNTKTWRWVHVTFTFLVFAVALGFMFLAALAQKTQRAWVGLNDKLTKELTQTTEQLQTLIRGNPQNPESVEQSLVALRRELEATLLDRGRVWRGCIPQFNPDGTVTLLTAPPPPPPLDPAAPPPAAPPATKNNIAPKTVLHAFREGPLVGAAAPAPDAPPADPAAPAVLVPAAYIGEFEVTAATDQNVTVRATMPLMPDQIAAGRTQGPWVLYEVCPPDGHRWFTQRIAGLEPAQARDLLQRLIPQAAVRLPNDQYARLIDSFLLDGKEAPENAPPENVWIPVKFLKPHKIQVDAPSANSLDVEAFNAEGQAQWDRLRRAAPGGEPVTIEFGPEANQIATATLDKQTAENLIAQGIAVQDGKPIFRRRLIDFERKFHLVNLRMAELNMRIRELDLDNKALVAAKKQADAQAKLLDELKANLQSDLSKAQEERDALAKYVAQLESRVTEVQTRLSQLYRANKALSRELVDLNTRLTQEIERRTREATARTP